MTEDTLLGAAGGLLVGLVVGGAVGWLAKGPQELPEQYGGIPTPHPGSPPVRPASTRQAARWARWWGR